MNNTSANTRNAKPASPSRSKRKTSDKAAWLDSTSLVDMWEVDFDEGLEDSDEFRILEECSDPALRAMLGLPLH